MNFNLKTLAVAAVLSFGASMAGAASYTSDNSCDVMDVDPNSDDCWGLAVENANAQQLDLAVDTFDGDYLFGQNDWVDIQSDGNFEGGDSGSFDVIANAYTEVVILLKSANTFAAYLFEDGFTGTLEYWTANGNGLSNYRVVGRMSDIPLPASALLLLGGLGGLALMRRRK